MRKNPEFEILSDHTDMFEIDSKNNILVPLENATQEVRDAIESLNKKMNRKY